MTGLSRPFHKLLQCSLPRSRHDTLAAATTTRKLFFVVVINVTLIPIDNAIPIATIIIIFVVLEFLIVTCATTADVVCIRP
jgi:hypothetical protein